jgi:hypothetical protein
VRAGALLVWFCIWSGVSSSVFCGCVSVLVAMWVVSGYCSVVVFDEICILLLVVWREILVIGAGSCSVAFVLRVLSWSSVSAGMSLELRKLFVYLGKL